MKQRLIVIFLIEIYCFLSACGGKSQPSSPLQRIKGEAVHKNNELQPPRFLHKVAPAYPYRAHLAGKEGVIILEATIDVGGVARDIQVIKGIGYGCDEAAVASIKASQFAPAVRGGKTVAFRIQLPYRFRLEQREKANAHYNLGVAYGKQGESDLNGTKITSVRRKKPVLVGLLTFSVSIVSGESMSLS